jgi:hypothetical protein
LELLTNEVSGTNTDLEGFHPCIDCSGTRRSDGPAGTILGVTMLDVVLLGC